MLKTPESTPHPHTLCIKNGLISPFRVRLGIQKCLLPPASLNKIDTGLNLLPLLSVTHGDGPGAIPCTGSRRPEGY